MAQNQAINIRNGTTPWPVAGVATPEARLVQPRGPLGQA